MKFQNIEWELYFEFCIKKNKIYKFTYFDLEEKAQNHRKDIFFRSKLLFSKDSRIIIYCKSFGQINH